MVKFGVQTSITFQPSGGAIEGNDRPEHFPVAKAYKKFNFHRVETGFALAFFVIVGSELL